MILEDIVKHIHFKPQGKVVHLFAIITNDLTAVIKFAIKGNEWVDHWYLIPDIDVNPIKVYGATAAISFCPMQIIGKTEEELINLISSWTEQDLITMGENAIPINKTEDYFSATVS
jgi:hypothetical protein